MQRRLLITGLSLSVLTVILMAAVLPIATAQRSGTRPTRTSSSSLTQHPTPAGGAQAASTQLMQTAADAQATLNAVATNAAISKGDNGTTVSYAFPEATVSTAVSAALAAAGYANASANLVPGGIVITIPNMSYGQWSGTLVATYAVGVDNGSITVSVISITIAGHNVPTSAFDALTQSLVSALNSIIAATCGATVVTYTVDSIVISDTQMTVSMTLDYTGDLPQPDVTPVFTPSPRPHR